MSVGERRHASVRDAPRRAAAADDRVRVFLVDDHELVRRGLRSLLEAESDLVVVGEADTAEQARQGLRRCAADVAVVDGRLPDGHGVEICREITAHATAQGDRPSTRTLMLTSYEDDEAMLAAVVAGASGYLLKQTGELGLVEAVRRVAAGESLLEPALVARAMTWEQERNSRVSGITRLTRREREVLELLADGHSNRQIAARLVLSEKTVKNHVTGVLAKLGLQRRTQAAAMIARRRAEG